ncbi:hypothetical protein BD413DRAFT_92705 [Trametes elegans]|nr:hypothetical protein BD413DRAFT_92705 [Trametes elegans]
MLSLPNRAGLSCNHAACSAQDPVLSAQRDTERRIAAFLSPHTGERAGTSTADAERASVLVVAIRASSPLPTTSEPYPPAFFPQASQPGPAHMPHASPYPAGRPSRHLGLEHTPLCAQTAPWPQENWAAVLHSAMPLQFLTRGGGSALRIRGPPAGNAMHSRPPESVTGTPGVETWHLTYGAGSLATHRTFSPSPSIPRDVPAALCHARPLKHGRDMGETALA